MKNQIFSKSWFITTFLFTILFFLILHFAHGQKIENASSEFKYWYEIGAINHRGYTSTHTMTLDSLGHPVVLRDTVSGQGRFFWDLRFEITKALRDTASMTNKFSTINPPAMQMFFSYPEKHPGTGDVRCIINVRPMMAYKDVAIFHVLKGNETKPFVYPGLLYVSTREHDMFMMYVYTFKFRGRSYEAQLYWGDVDDRPWDQLLWHYDRLRELILNNSKK